MLRVAATIEQLEARGGGATTAYTSVMRSFLEHSDRVSMSGYFPKQAEGDPMEQYLKDTPQVDWRATGPTGSFASGDLGRRIAGDAAAGEFDVLHIQGAWSPDLVRAARGCKAAGVPYVWMPHGMLMRNAFNQKRLKKELFMRLGLAKALRGAESIWFASSGERDTSVLPAGVDRERISFLSGLPVIAPEDDAELTSLVPMARERFELSEDAEVMVFIGRLHPVKQIERAIDVLHRVRQDRANAHLLLMGKGDPDYVESLKEHAANRGVLEFVRFSGWVTDEEKWGGLAMADVAVVVSMFESFSYALVEALAAGTPGVISDNLCIREEVETANVAVVVANEVEQIAEGVVKVLSNASHRSELGARARRWAMDMYAPHALGARFIDHLSAFVRS